MAFDIHNLSITEFALIVIIFVLFIIALKKALGIIKNALVIGAASALFPIIARWLGFPLAVDANSIIFFLTIGLGIYAVYLIAKSVYTVLGLAEGKVKKQNVVKYIEKKDKKKEDDEE